MVDDDLIRVLVMVFNIEDGGTLVDLGCVVEAIRRADPDVVALQEAMGNTARIATALGWPYASARTQVLSRRPLVERDDGTVDVVIRPDRAIRVASVHLPAEPYGPAPAATTRDADIVVELERRIRLPPIEAVLAVLAGGLDAGADAAPDAPIFLAGDFNAPSHLDWTPAAIRTRPQVTTAIDWPVSRAIEAAGFRDAWREAHPDPVAEPGLTWWARRPTTGGFEPGSDAPEDRIDMIYVAGPVRIVETRIVGESGGPGVDIEVDPWPSDHRAVVTTALVRPQPIVVDQRRVALASATLTRPTGPVPVTVSATRYRVGEPIEVSWAEGPGYRWDWIAVFAAPATELGDRHLLWRHTGARPAGMVRLDADAAIVDQSWVGGRWPLPPGDYEAVYLLDDAPEPLGRAAFTIEA